MAYPVYTNSLANGQSADASKVMQDFNDILAGVTDGTKDLSVANVTASNVSGTHLTVANTATVNGNAVVGGELQGSRAVISFGAMNINLTNSSGYFLNGSTLGGVETSMTMPRAGSIVGYSVMANAWSHASTMSLKFDFRKNNSDIFSSSSVTASTATMLVAYGTFARNANTFAAGDRLQAYVDITAPGNVSWVLIPALEVQFNT